MRPFLEKKIMVYGATRDKGRRKGERLRRKESGRVALAWIGERHERLVNQSDEVGIGTKLTLQG